MKRYLCGIAAMRREVPTLRLLYGGRGRFEPPCLGDMDTCVKTATAGGVSNQDLLSILEAEQAVKQARPRVLRQVAKEDR